MGTDTRFESAQTQLMKIPGVVAVHLGYKEVQDKLTDQFGLRVYVKTKKKPEALKQEELIPAEINGFVTDVLRAFKIIDTSKGGTRPLVGGLEITQYVGTTLVETDTEERRGTMGCVAQKNSDNSYVLLSCQHVLDYATPVTDNHMVRQPQRNSSSFHHYENIVGTIQNGIKDTIHWEIPDTNLVVDCYIDCAIASINKDIGQSNTIDDIGVVNGSEDLSKYIADSPTGPPLPVRKKGMKTGLTKGSIAEFDYASSGTMLIVPDPDTPDTMVQYSVDLEKKNDIITYYREHETRVTVTDPDPLGHYLNFTYKTFTLGGDSGSAIIIDGNKIIGILTGVTTTDYLVPVRVGTSIVEMNLPNGLGVACHIAPVLKEMDIKIVAGTFTSSGEILDFELEIPAEQPMVIPEMQDALKIAENDLMSIPIGRQIVEVFHQHAKELVKLVHHYRPVKLAWHRFKGPAFSAYFLNGIRDREKIFSKFSEGITVQFAAENILKAIKDAASPALQEAFIKYEHAFCEMVTGCNNYEEALNYIRKINRRNEVTIEPLSGN